MSCFSSSANSGSERRPSLAIFAERILNNDASIAPIFVRLRKLKGAGTSIPLINVLRQYVRDTHGVDIEESTDEICLLFDGFRGAISTSGLKRDTAAVVSGAAAERDGCPFHGAAYYGGLASAFSEPDLATTVAFVDSVLTPGATRIRRVHITELRVAPYTGPNVVPGARIKAVHVTALRDRTQ